MEKKTVDRKAPVHHDIHDLLVERWSPRAFSGKEIEKDKLHKIFEAARWAPSAYNEQPWRFIIGFKGDETYKKIVDTLVEFNQIWTATAPILVLNICRKTFSLNENPNPTASYDLGQAVAHLSIEATAQGLHVHQMSGFEPDVANKLFKIPENYKSTAVMAIGYIGDPSQLPENIAQMEHNKRERNTSKSFVFSKEFGNFADM
ncbi:MAG: nitroreductase family protein [Bacteroidales bacterium]